MTVREHEGGPELDDAPEIRLKARPPKTVAILGCGPTNSTWHASRFTYEPQTPAVEEVWAVNKGLRTQRADLVFILDDLVGEARRSPEYADDIRKLTVPVVTSTVDDAVRRLFPNVHLIEYPVERIIWTLGMRILAARAHRERILERPDLVYKFGMEGFYYLHNSIPMMLAFALVMGVKGIQLFGVDYTFPGQDVREDDRACCEFWVGALRMAGVEVLTCSGTTLLNTRRQPWIYGYGQRPPVVRVPTREQLEVMIG